MSTAAQRFLQDAAVKSADLMHREVIRPRHGQLRCRSPERPCANQRLGSRTPEVSTDQARSHQSP